MRHPRKKSYLKQKDKLEEDSEAIELSKQIIGSLSSKAFDEFKEELTEKTSEILSILTDDTYIDIAISEQLAIEVFKENEWIPIEKLSNATMEQIYFSLRLSLTELLFPNESMPLLLDNSFAFYDDKRLEDTLRFLTSDYNGQVIIFTSNHREEELLQQLEVDFSKISLNF
ncbi:hypothetical protein P261_01537 [Lachnospiraceae bacterium TWA4]|nr:hypothetical protein P261_01537 [Lachnospiraceae bacterium TWA4]